MKSKQSQFILMILLLTVVGLVQTPLLVNLQLLVKRPFLFPDFDFYTPGMDLVFTFIASGYLLVKWKHFGFANWWRGFAVLMFGYLILKSIGVYYDHTIYLIAQSSGESVGGGAAMAHIPLFLALMGPLQLLSASGFSEFFKKLYMR